MTGGNAKPRITYIGENGMEELDWDEVPAADAVELADHFKPVKLSPRAINLASQIVPSEHWVKEGLYTWLSKRADYVFGKLSSSERSGRLRNLKYEFGFDAEGPVLEKVWLIQ
jgi:hypothetical protein